MYDEQAALLGRPVNFPLHESRSARASTKLGRRSTACRPGSCAWLRTPFRASPVLYMVIATAGTIWYAVMVKDNYLVNCVLYTAITNTIMSIVVTGPL